MKYYINFRYIAVVLILITNLPFNAYADSKTKIPAGTNQYKLINGTAIYIGVVPAEIIQGHFENKMHGGMPQGYIRFHLTVAIFNDKTGKRINNARIRAQIFTIPEKTGFKDLEPMEYGKALVYGNYFALQALGPYLVQLHIEHKTIPEPIDVEFQYQTAYTQLKI